MKRKIERMTAIQRLKFLKMLEAEYSTSGMTDRQFGEYAGKAIGFEITPQCVHGNRVALDIPINRLIPKPEDKTGRLERLEAAVAEMQATLAALQKELGLIQ